MAGGGDGVQLAVGSGIVQVQHVGPHAQLSITVSGGSPQRLPLQAAVIRVGARVRSPTRLGELGRREEGLAAIEEAVAIRRRLAEANPAAYLPALANSLNSLADTLRGLGRVTEADVATGEALAALEAR